MAKAVLALFLIFFSSSCFNQGDCLITASPYTKIDFYQKKDKTPKIITFSYVEVFGAGTAYQDSVVSSLLLPVDPNGDTTRFVLHYEDKSDFITVKYSSITRIISPECGAFVYYKDLEIVKTSFDETLIRLTNNQLLKDAVNNKYATNLQVFF